MCILYPRERTQTKKEQPKNNQCFLTLIKTLIILFIIIIIIIMRTRRKVYHLLLEVFPPLATFSIPNKHEHKPFAILELQSGKVLKTDRHIHYVIIIYLFFSTRSRRHVSPLSSHTSSCCRDRDTWRAGDQGKALLSPACRLDLRGVAGGWPQDREFDRQTQEPHGAPDPLLHRERGAQTDLGSLRACTLSVLQ